MTSAYHIEKGEIFSLIGPNGAGKQVCSTVLVVYISQLLARFVTKGQEIVNMKPYNRTTLGIARAFQNIALFAHMSVLDNLKLGRHTLMNSGAISGGLYVGKASKEEIEHRKKVEEVIEFLRTTRYTAYTCWNTSLRITKTSGSRKSIGAWAGA